jgi:chromate transporter
MTDGTTAAARSEAEKAAAIPVEAADATPPDAVRGTPGEVFAAFLKLGLTSFGGPIAHLGHFRAELVTRRGWIDEAGYADLVALCQFLPGPASSQVGFALGLRRAGLAGALAAWTAFTMPSAAALAGYAAVAAAFAGSPTLAPVGAGLIAGLKLVAVAVVAQAVWGMARGLAPDRTRAGIVLAAVAIIVLVAGPAGPLAALATGALAGWRLCRDNAAPPQAAAGVGIGRRGGAVALVVFAGLLVGLPLAAAATGGHAVAVAAAFYRAGALVFGGGHVVLPLLQAEVVGPGWIAPDGFLAGYGAAQAVPGPLFTVAAYLGAAMTPAPNGVAGAVLALAAVFLPGLLLVAGVLPFWDRLGAHPAIDRPLRAAMRGANAAVVGVLAAALYDPVFTSAVHDPRDFAAALAGVLLLTVWRAPPWIVVVLLAATGTARAVLAA